MALCSAWTTAEDALAVRPSAASELDADALDNAVLSASNLLYALSGRQFKGICTKTVRPTARPSNVMMQRWVSWISQFGGYWVPAIGAWDYDASSGDVPMSIPLGVFPVDSIEQVTIDGEIIDPSIYRVDNSRLLVRQDGGVWPVWQNIQLPLDQPGTFGVTVNYGEDPPQAGIDAAKSFAIELALAWSGSDSRLPSGVISVSRQNVTETMISPMDFYKLGLTGVAEVDSFLTAYNPSGRRHRPRVISPDVVRTRS